MVGKPEVNNLAMVRSLRSGCNQACRPLTSLLLSEPIHARDFRRSELIQKAAHQKAGGRPEASEREMLMGTGRSYGSRHNRCRMFYSLGGFGGGGWQLGDSWLYLEAACICRHAHCLQQLCHFMPFHTLQRIPESAQRGRAVPRGRTKTSTQSGMVDPSVRPSSRKSTASPSLPIQLLACVSEKGDPQNRTVPFEFLSEPTCKGYPQKHAQKHRNTRAAHPPLRPIAPISAPISAPVAARLAQQDLLWISARYRKEAQASKRPRWSFGSEQRVPSCWFMELRNIPYL